MTEDENMLLQEIHVKTGSKPYTSRNILESSTGFDPLRINIAIEDLKQKQLLIETDYGLELSFEGKSYCRSRWA